MPLRPLFLDAADLPLRPLAALLFEAPERRDAPDLALPVGDGARSATESATESAVEYAAELAALSLLFILERPLPPGRRPELRPLNPALRPAAALTAPRWRPPERRRLLPLLRFEALLERLDAADRRDPFDRREPRDEALLTPDFSDALLPFETPDTPDTRETPDAATETASTAPS